MPTTNARGFTLAELMMVVAIVGLVVAMGGYTLYASGKSSTERADMVAALTQARNMALARGECAVFSVTGQKALISTYAPDASTGCSGPFKNPLRTAAPVSFASSVKISNFSSTNQTLVFNSLGGLTPEAIVTFDVDNGAGRHSSFKVYPAIGQIRVQ